LKPSRKRGGETAVSRIFLSTEREGGDVGGRGEGEGGRGQELEKGDRRDRGRALHQKET